MAQHPGFFESTVHHGHRRNHRAMSTHHATHHNSAPTPVDAPGLKGADEEFYSRTHGPNAQDPNAVELAMAREGTPTIFGVHATSATPTPDAAKPAAASATKQALPRKPLLAPGMTMA